MHNPHIPDTAPRVRAQASQLLPTAVLQGIARDSVTPAAAASFVAACNKLLAGAMELTVLVLAPRDECGCVLYRSFRLQQAVCI